jgi:branched-chain amino acid transport system ATP-binding protein
MNGAILETVDLSVRFGGVEAVSSVNFTLAERELRCLIGPNGAGKSTLFKLLTGQLRPTAGRILFRGHDITGGHTHAIARRGIGITTQVPSLFDGLTVREHLWLSARRTNPAARTREIVDEILERVRLTSLANEVVGQLSHGLRQWVELGTVLAGDPTLILLDEPAAGMTHDEVARTAELVRDINRTHALIVVEHDMQFVKMIARTVTVMHQGGVLVEDTMDRILMNSTVRDVYLGKHGGV